MKKKRILPILVALLLVLWLAGSALAMTSPTYRLDWYTPATSSGGGFSISAHYAVNLTVGQAATGSASSPSYKAGLGYWPGILVQWLVRLPIVIKD